MQCSGQQLFRSFISLLNLLQRQMSERHSFQLADVGSTLTNQCTEPRKSWLVWQVSSKEPYVPCPSGVYSSIIKWEVKVITLLLQVFRGSEAFLCLQKHLTLEKACLVLSYFLRWTDLYIKFLLFIFFFYRYSAESQSSVSEACSESL